MSKSGTISEQALACVNETTIRDRGSANMSKLYFYYSAMNAGKTTKLLQSNFNYKERGMNTIMYTFCMDKDDNGNHKINSRIGLASDANLFDVNTNIFLDAQQKMKDAKINCIFIDEAQFLTKEQVYQLCRIVDELGIPVICYGLRSDFMGEPFDGSKYLLTLADELEEVKTICHCGKKATMNVRILPNGKIVDRGQQIEIGKNDKYVSLCRKHYMEKNLG